MNEFDSGYVCAKSLRISFPRFLLRPCVEQDGMFYTTFGCGLEENILEMRIVAKR